MSLLCSVSLHIDFMSTAYNGGRCAQNVWFTHRKNVWIKHVTRKLDIDGLVQERHNSIVLAMELRLSCSNQSMYGY